MNIKRIAATVTFLLAWGAVALALMPIKLMINQWGAPLGMDVRDPSGTLWDGQAQISVRWGGSKRPLSAAVMWQWCPGWQRGLLSMCVEAENEMISGTGFVYRGLFDNRLGIDDASLKVKFATHFNELFPLPIELSGIGDIRAEHLRAELNGNYLPDVIKARGKLTGMSANEVELGDYILSMDSEEDRHINANIRGGNDAFQVKAQARLSLASRKYRYEAELRSEYPEVRSMIEPFAKAEGDNRYSISGERVLP